jgi:hypothetical protein
MTMNNLSNDLIFNISLFIERLSLPSFADVILNTEERCQHFYINYYGNNRSKADDLLDYREYLIEQNDFTLEDLEQSVYTIGIKEAFEKMFIQKFSVTEISLINKSVSDGVISLKDIFTDFKKNPNKNIMKNIL